MSISTQHHSTSWMIREHVRIQIWGQHTTQSTCSAIIIDLKLHKIYSKINIYLQKKPSMTAKSVLNRFYNLICKPVLFSLMNRKYMTYHTWVYQAKHCIYTGWFENLVRSHTRSYSIYLKLPALQLYRVCQNSVTSFLFRHTTSFCLKNNFASVAFYFEINVI